MTVRPWRSNPSNIDRGTAAPPTTNRSRADRSHRVGSASSDASIGHPHGGHARCHRDAFSRRTGRARSRRPGVDPVGPAALRRAPRHTAVPTRLRGTSGRPEGLCPLPIRTADRAGPQPASAAPGRGASTRRPWAGRSCPRCSTSPPRYARRALGHSSGRAAGNERLVVERPCRGVAVVSDDDDMREIACSTEMFRTSPGATRRRRSPCPAASSTM